MNDDSAEVFRDAFQAQLNEINLRQVAVENAIAAIRTIELPNQLNHERIEADVILAALESRMLETLVRARLPTSLDISLRASDAPAPQGKLLSLDEQESAMRALVPVENWLEYVRARDAGTQSYIGLPQTSCSTERHPQAHLFRAFLRSYLRGAVLDIGCGPQAVPFYLVGYPSRAICGIDPISSTRDHPFKFVSGYGEMLPWADASFDVIVSATTLDHYFLLDRGLAEAWRVLKTGGHFVAWITHFADAPAYDPYKPGLKSYDDEHMYHVNLDWFVPLMRSVGFVENEILEFPLPFRYLFMSFEKI